MHFVRSLAVSLVMLTSPVLAHAAEHARAALTYTVEGSAGSTCPDRDQFRQLVAARLGYDPFDGGDDATIDVRVDATTKRFAGVISVKRGAAEPRKRALTDAACEPLANALASAVAISLDPAMALRGPPAATSPAPVAEPPALPPLVAPPATSSEEPPARLPPPPPPPVVPVVELDATVAFGRAPIATLGARLSAGIRYGHFAANVEGRAETTPSDAQLTARDRAEFTLLTGGFAVCGLAGVLDACGVFGIGTVQAKALDVSRPTLEDSLYASAGARVGVSIPVTWGLELRAHGELGIALRRATFVIDDAPAWTASPITFTGSLGAGWRFR